MDERLQALLVGVGLVENPYLVNKDTEAESTVTDNSCKTIAEEQLTLNEEVCVEHVVKQDLTNHIDDTSDEPVCNESIDVEHDTYGIESSPTDTQGDSSELTGFYETLELAESFGDCEINSPCDNICVDEDIPIDDTCDELNKDNDLSTDYQENNSIEQDSYVYQEDNSELQGLDEDKLCESDVCQEDIHAILDEEEIVSTDSSDFTNRIDVVSEIENVYLDNYSQVEKEPVDTPDKSNKENLTDVLLSYNINIDGRKKLSNGLFNFSYSCEDNLDLKLSIDDYLDEEIIQESVDCNKRKKKGFLQKIWRK